MSALVYFTGRRSLVHPLTMWVYETVFIWTYIKRRLVICTNKKGQYVK